MYIFIQFIPSMSRVSQTFIYSSTHSFTPWHRTRLIYFNYFWPLICKPTKAHVKLFFFIPLVPGVPLVKHTKQIRACQINYRILKPQLWPHQKHFSFIFLYFHLHSIVIISRSYIPSLPIPFFLSTVKLLCWKEFIRKREV